MSLKPGVYFVQPVSYNDRFVGTGPVPRVHPTPPVPLLSISEPWKDMFEVTLDEGDKYIFKLLALRMYVASDRDNYVRLNLYGGRPVQWAVDRAGGDGVFNIKLPNEDKCWTITSPDDLASIRLEGADGNPGQQWKFIPAIED